MESNIIKLCNDLNRAIHEPLFHNFYNTLNKSRYNQTFTSIDLIEDAQIAIEEFENTEAFKVERSTLFIYLFMACFNHYFFNKMVFIIFINA